MTVSFDAKRVLQIGVEQSAGSPVAASKRMQSIKATPTSIPTTTSIMASGSLFPTVMVAGKEMAASPMTIEPTYGEIIWPFASLFGAPDGGRPTTPSGGTPGVSYQWKWTLSAGGLLTPQSYTAEYGDATEGEQYPYFTFSGMQLQVNRDRIAGSGTVFGQAAIIPFTMTAIPATTNDVQTVTITGTPTGGTFTLTFRGQTTSTIAYNAASSAVQTALQALSTVGAGNMLVTGGPGPGTPYVVTAAGTLAGINLEVMTANASGLTGGTSPAVTVVHTTDGGTPYVESPMVPIQPKTVDVYLDASYANIGTTKLLRNYELTWNMGDAFDQAWALNSANPSFSDITPKPPNSKIDLNLAFDTQGQSLLTAIRNDTRLYLRWKATGPVIEGTIHYALIIDTPINVAQGGQPRAVNGVYTRTFTTQAMDDSAMAAASIITVINKVPAL